MVTIQAWQHVYANVEREQSPHGRSGFQTLLATRAALTEADIDTIESRLVYHRAAIAPLKRVFFTTPSGKAVMTQIVPLAETDHLGRQGRYLAHSLVFARDLFVSLKVDPFAVFRQGWFCTTVAEALARGDCRTGDMAAVSITLPEAPARPSVAQWALSDLQQWSLLALRAAHLAQERQAVVVVGEPEQVAEALEMVYTIVPTSLRMACTFDTYFQHCNLVATYYWAIGELEAPGQTTVPWVDTRARQLHVAVPAQAETAYERWVWQALAHQEPEAMARDRDQAEALCSCLEGRSTAWPHAVSPALLTSVFAVNTAQIQTHLVRALRPYLPRFLARHLAAAMSSQQTAPALYDYLQHGMTPPHLLEALYQLYTVSACHPPRRAERRVLRMLLHHAEHQKLQILYSCWTRQWERLSEELAVLSPEAYVDFVRIALETHLAPPRALVVAGRGADFLEVALAQGLLHRHGFYAVVQSLLAAGDAASLIRLSPYVDQQPPRQIRAVARLIRRHSDTPARFCHAVCTAVNALPSRGVHRWRQVLWRR